MRLDCAKYPCAAPRTVPDEIVISHPNIINKKCTRSVAMFICAKDLVSKKRAQKEQCDQVRLSATSLWSPYP